MPQPIQIPTYKLYGEHEPWPTPDMVHCETISSRSKLHNWRIKPHQHQGLFQLVHLNRGGARLLLDGQRRSIRAEEVLTVPQLCVHGFEFDSDTEGHVISLAYPLLQKLGQPGAAAVLAAPQVLAVDQEDAGVRMAFEALAREYRHGAPHRERMLESLLAIILVWLARNPARPRTELQPAGNRAERHIAQFLRLIEEGYASHHGVAHYAHRLGISAAHLNALCRAATHRSALELIHERLVLEAKRNLVYTSMSVNLVSYALGFSDPAYFTRFFKRATGLAPRDFRHHARAAFGQENGEM